jgi:hypothetical protein
MQQVGEEIKVSTEDVPLEKYRLRPEQPRRLHPMWQVAEGLGAIRIEKGEAVWV